jgi:hypothetical protein
LNDLRQALAKINAIRTQVARDTQFRGYGPLSIAASGILALVVAAIQSRQMTGGKDFLHSLLVWVGTAAVTIALTATETIGRTRRVHSGLASEMIQLAIGQFLPAIITGVLLTVVLARVAPQNLWMLPGLWQLLFSLGVFASCRFLPRQIIVVAIWYLVAGLVCLVLQSGSKSFSPWSMGIPFGIGQLMVAAILRFGSEESVEET